VIPARAGQGSQVPPVACIAPRHVDTDTRESVGMTWGLDCLSLTTKSAQDFVRFNRKEIKEQGLFPAHRLPAFKPQFTGKERDAETGLDYFGARYMSAAQGRFTSPDPLLSSAHIASPQSWNRYSYTLNNPLRFGACQRL
jgi:RHS repeat-associated protein